MARTASRIKAWNKIAMVMLSGEPIPVDKFQEFFKGDEKMERLAKIRLSTYMWDLKNSENAVIKVHKTGRNVTAYQLVNAKDFNSEGINTTITTVATKAVAVAAPVVESAVEPAEVVDTIEESDVTTE